MEPVVERFLESLQPRQPTTKKQRRRRGKGLATSASPPAPPSDPPPKILIPPRGVKPFEQLGTPDRAGTKTRIQPRNARKAGMTERGAAILQYTMLEPGDDSRVIHQIGTDELGGAQPVLGGGPG